MCLKVYCTVLYRLNIKSASFPSLTLHWLVGWFEHGERQREGTALKGT